MRKPNKPALRKALLTTKGIVQDCSKNVLDGGALLHKVRWTSCTNFGDVCQQYVNYVSRNYATCTTVFDGYNHGMSTKDHEHARRSTKQSNTQIDFSESTKCRIKQDVFLYNSTNKSRFITLLSRKLREDGNNVIECEEDADTHIARCAIQFAREGANVNVVADDTDVALLLMYHWDETMADITLTSQRANTTFDIKRSINSHHRCLKPYYLVVHSCLGVTQLRQYT